MTKKEKLITKFKKAPETLSLQEITNILQWLDIEIIQGKGSHIICHIEEKTLLVIPIHNNDCKPYYKKSLLKLLTHNNLLP